MRFVALKELAEIERNGIAAEKIVAGTTYLGLEHIESGGRIIAAKPVDAGDLASTKFRFGPDHLLYGKLRPYLAKIALPDFAGVCSTDILPVRPGPELDKRYLAYFLRQPSMVDFANAHSTGANLPRLTPKALGEFQVPWRPLPEQQRIAAILDQADALRRLRRRSLEMLSRLEISVFESMFGAKFDGSGPRIGDVCERVETWNPAGAAGDDRFLYLDLGSIDQNEKRFNLPGPIPRVEAPSRARQRVREGDVLVSTVRPYLNGVAVVPDVPADATGSTGFAVLRPREGETTTSFLFSVVRSQKFIDAMIRQSTGASYPAVSDKIVKSFHLPDSSADERSVFSDKIEAIRQGIGHAEKQLASADALFASLQQRAFNGEL